MASWIYLFAKFTPEALLFEALAILVLTATYTGFWVLHKRRTGVAKNDIPANLVRGYLSELITDAEQLRTQLFGLLAAAGVPMGTAAAYAAVPMPAPTPASVTPVAVPSASDPELARKLAALEAKMTEQARAMEAILADKTRLEKELAEARAAKTSGSANPEIPKLQEKIHNLEGKLAEYSVIEDDLANLKRLQQENTQLRAALAGKGAVPAPAPAASAPSPAVAAAAPQASAAAAADPAAPADTAFEGLVDQVEASLQEAAPASDADLLAGLEDAPLEAPAEAAPAAPAAEPVTATEAAPGTTTGGGKTDEDLVAEFEKMLNS